MASISEKLHREFLPLKFREDFKGMTRGYHLRSAESASYGLRLSSDELGVRPHRLEELVGNIETRKLSLEHGVSISYRPESKTVEIERRDVKAEEAAEGRYHEAVHAAFIAFVELVQSHPRK